ncbi:MAG: hypothetical protein JSV62_02940 [Promethearchaeota archaeon]|nr:MAG: hypothetical protein JSV62_02940 [Candidatus Lokiarchaeota archaeon]
MSLQELGISHKKIKKKFVMYFNFRGEIKDIPPKIDEISHKYKDFIYKPCIAVIDYGVYSEGGKDIDLCFQIEEQKKSNNNKTKFLESIEVLSLMHQGELDTLNKTFQKISEYLQEHLISGTSWLRLVFHKYDEKGGEENLIEVQYQLHKWDDRLEKSLDKVLGEETRLEIMKNRDKLFTLESSKEDRIKWLKDTLIRIDKIANENEKYEILSFCAHEFSQKRIEFLKNIYEKNRNIDDVLNEMRKDYAWYENPIRKNNKIYVSKIPVNPEAYDKAKTPQEKKENYCHCRFINSNLDKDISPTFCNCSAGWYRQYWEKILGKPIQINILKSLLKNDDSCQFEIIIPENP